MDRGRVVIMGSGETAPTMVEVHRSTLSAAGGPGGRSALMLDTSYGFQENADQLTRRSLDYFQASVGYTVTPLGWRSRLAGIELDRALSQVRGARWVFAGIGSPSYTAKVWSGSGFAEAIVDMVDAGGCATFSSAAAITLGTAAMPVHEIYRCGEQPYWMPGLDVLRSLTGLSVAVVPHYDYNTKGGTHDARFCYIGERRMRMLESQLPAGTHVIGLDEHTALDLDLAAGTARVAGRGTVTVRIEGRSTILPTGTVVPITGLGPTRGRPVSTEPAASATTTTAATTQPGQPALSLRGQATRAYQAFTSALAAEDSDAAGVAVLELEQALADDAAGDASSSTDAEHTRRVMRGMVLKLANTATGPRPLIEPLVGALLDQRAQARARRDFVTADKVRAQMAAAGVEVRDCPTGVEWSLRT